ncbi:MAG: hypothetical protein ACKO6N_15480 [Myxococcota bacterium]
MRQVHIFFVMVLLSLVGCGAEEDPLAITYHEDLAPVLEKQCLSCHQTGGIAPFSLQGYDAAKQYASAMRQSVTSRRMPPQPLLHDGSCQTFTNARWMSDDEIRLFGEWMDQGMLEGNPDAVSPTPVEASGLTGEVVSLKTPTYRPKPSSNSGLNDDYRCFLIEPGFDTDKFLTAFEVEPGNPALVHHVLAFSVAPNQVVDEKTGVTNRQVIEGLQAESGGTPGWTCYGLSGEGVVPNGLPASWAPGAGVTRYPDNTGLRLRAGEWLVVQLHYNLDYAEGEDSTTLRLELKDGVFNEGVNLLDDGFLQTLSDEVPASLPPGDSSVLFQWEVTFEEVEAFVQTYYGYDGALPELTIFGVYPHMHGLGRSMYVSLEGAGGQTCAVNVTDWDFNWQQFYFYAQPLVFKPGDAVKVTCEFDTRGQDTAVLPGLGTADEMCMLGAFVNVSLF